MGNLKKKFTYRNFITWLNEKLKGTLKLKSLKKEFVSEKVILIHL